MFTGIVIDQGLVKRARTRRGITEVEIETSVARKLEPGDSIAVNGVCLTATSAHHRRFTTEIMSETTARSTLSDMRKGQRVNLELPMRPSDRLGGHIVQGHVDGMGTVLRVEEDGDARRMWLSAPADLLGYLIEKGSVALDGVSLTIVEVGTTSFQVALIPHTLHATTLGSAKPGSLVNIEIDLIAKYVSRFVNGTRVSNKERIT
ncbi:MAG: riboflavin synthase [Actinomycetota bacterium]|nr:riboflavin synthase [Actinomycetota bacterium]